MLLFFHSYVQFRQQLRSTSTSPIPTSTPIPITLSSLTQNELTLSSTQPDSNIPHVSSHTFVHIQSQDKKKSPIIHNTLPIQNVLNVPTITPTNAPTVPLTSPPVSIDPEQKRRALSQWQKSNAPPIWVIHIRTSIDPTKSKARPALEKFGEYCIAGTEGSKLCLNLEQDIHLYPNECIIDTVRILSNDSFRPLKTKLKEIQDISKAPLRVAVIGGWTEEDIRHLCYELKTRTKAIDIATCSVLTASPSTSQHWSALSQMRQSMNVTITRTVRELIDWFHLGVTPYRLPGFDLRKQKTWPLFIWENEKHAIPSNFNMEVDGEILAHLYRKSSKIHIDVLAGGFSAVITTFHLFCFCIAILISVPFVIHHCMCYLLFSVIACVRVLY